MTDFPPFPGFRPEAFAFLRALAENNQRDWFKPRKTIFEDEVLWPMQCLVSDASRRASEERLQLTGEPKGSIFRIYRDTRFSKDKSPYKTHIGAFLTRTGQKDEHGGVYIHIEPGKSFLAAGFWRPENTMLRAWRVRMAQEPEQFYELVREVISQGLKLETDESLKRLPQGFNEHTGSQLADYLRWKSFLVTCPVKDLAAQSPAFTQDVVQFMHSAQPLLTYGWEIEKALRPS